MRRVAVELNEMQDRPAAIVASTLVEDAIEDVLRDRMARLSKSEYNRLFLGEGPLSNFSSKIQIAYAFKLLDKDWARQINIIRDIRNAFAHSRISIDFMTPEIVDQVNRIDVLDHFLNPAFNSLFPTTPRLQNEGYWQALKSVRLHVPRSRFLHSCLFVAFWLWAFPPKPEDWDDDLDDTKENDKGKRSKPHRR